METKTTEILRPKAT